MEIFSPEDGNIRDVVNGCLHKYEGKRSLNKVSPENNYQALLLFFHKSDNLRPDHLFILRPALEKGINIVHVTIGTSQKKPFFKNSEYARAVCEIVKDVAIEKGNALYAFCIMPDHIHILVQAAEGCSIIDYVKLLKERFSACCRKKGWDLRLQPGFYDPIIRKDEDLETVTEYIPGNPVRSGIVGSINEYPFSGSLVFEL